MADNFKAGQLKQQFEYKSFSPTKINKGIILTNPSIQIALSEANRLLGELNAYSQLVPDVDFFIKMHVTKEATESSRIEGTRTEFDEALMEEKNITPERKDDWLEVHNYTKAMNFAIDKLSQLPLSIRLLKETHKILLSGARGERKTPGEVRASQNWIGGSSIKDAFFIPPHIDELPNLLSDLEEFWHNNTLQIPSLVVAAISHYQFETIHPFLDGNGRIGRLLITLYLIEKKIITKPTLYLSNFFAKNKGSYYDSLTVVRSSNDITQWILFFLNGVIETSKSSIKTFQDIIKLRQHTETKILELAKRAAKGKDLLRYLYSSPIIEISDVAKELGTSHKTASDLVKSFENLSILVEKTGFKRNKLYEFSSYMNLFK